MAANPKNEDESWPIDGMAEWAREAHLRSTGIGLTAFEVVRATPWSIVIRWTLGQTQVWGKAVCPGFAAECGLLPLLAEQSPDRVLAPIAVDHGRGWLLLPDGGETQKDAATVTSWTQALLGYAQLQRSMIGAERRLLGVGCPDMRPDAAVDRLERMMEQGIFPEHRWLLDAAHDTADQIDLSLVPVSIQHDDLRPDNVFADGRVFDWGDASVAHPFASLLTALMPNRPGSAVEKAEMRDAYLESWQRFISEQGVAPSVDTLRWQATLAILLAPIGRIDSWLRAPSVALEIYPDAVDRWVHHMLGSDWP